MSDASLDRQLEELANDRVSGAAGLARKAIELSLNWLSAGKSPADLAQRLSRLHPGIATVANIARLLRKPPANLERRLQSLDESLEQAYPRIAEKLKGLIPPGASVVTLSSSSTVRDVLLHMEPRQVYVLESQPGGEGAALAGQLRERFAAVGRSDESAVDVVPDAAMALAVARAGAALVGIDTLDAAGGILHKVGTFPLALCCQRLGKPFYAAGHSLKRVPEQIHWEPEGPLEHVLFDYTPAELITQVVTEE